MSDLTYFAYSDAELESLKSKDKRLAMAIEKIGHIKREVDSDIIASVAHHIIAQQISTKAQESIWSRFCEKFGTKITSDFSAQSPQNTTQARKTNAITPNIESRLSLNQILVADMEAFRSCGVSARKAEYIIDFARKVQAREFDIERVKQMSNKEAIDELVKLRGIGVWTAEMILLFCLQRKDILSYDDLALQRALKLLYGIKGADKQDKIPKEIFAKYKAKFSPYGSIASLYLWEISSGKFEV